MNIYNKCTWYTGGPVHNTKKRANAITITNSLSIRIWRSVRRVFQGLSLPLLLIFSSLDVRCEHKFSPLPQSFMRVPVYISTRTRTHTDSFSSFGPLPACVPALAKGERKKKESKRTDNRITHLNNYRAVFFPLFSSELCIAWINYWCYYCALRLCTVIYRCMEGRRTLNPYMVLSDIYGLVQE